jgi:hypothetical protein
MEKSAPPLHQPSASSAITNEAATPDPIERPQSTISTISVHTSTSFNDSIFDEGLSTVTTPRGTSPISGQRYGNSNSDLPPSYDESQAQHLDALDSPGHGGGSSDIPRPLGPTNLQVYRTEVQYYPPGMGGLQDANRSTETLHAPRADEPRAGALLSQALAFTSAPPPASLTASYVTRPVAVPALPVLDSGGVRFARLYSRALQSASITPAQFAAFIDGLNAISTASGFSIEKLHGSGSFNFDFGLGNAPDGDVSRDEWMGAYMQLCNARFFEPRGLRVQVTTLKELVALAKVPVDHGFRQKFVKNVLNAMAAGHFALEDVDEEVGDHHGVLFEAAQTAAKELEPYVEPLDAMIPTFSQASADLDNVARGLRAFQLAESDDKTAPTPAESSTTGAEERPHPLHTSSFPLIFDIGPKGLLHFGPKPPRLPLSVPRKPVPGQPLSPGQPGQPGQLQRGQSWQEWSDDFGKRWEQWGQDYGKKWNDWGLEYGKKWSNWGDQYGKKWENWGENFQRKFSMPPTPGSATTSRSQTMDPDCPIEKRKEKHKQGKLAKLKEKKKKKFKKDRLRGDPCVSKESFSTARSSSSHGSSLPATPSTGDPEEEQDFDWDDGASDISSVSSSSLASSSSSDTEVEFEKTPEAVYSRKVAEIEETAAKARATGKKGARWIERERSAGLEKALKKRQKNELKLKQRAHKRQIKRIARRFKHRVKEWKYQYKRQYKDMKKTGATRAELHQVHAQQMAVFAEIHKEFADQMAQSGMVDEWMAKRSHWHGQHHGPRQHGHTYGHHGVMHARPGMHFRGERALSDRFERGSRHGGHPGGHHPGGSHSRGGRKDGSGWGGRGRGRGGRRWGGRRGGRGCDDSSDEDEDEEYEAESIADSVTDEADMLWVVIRSIE